MQTSFGDDRFVLGVSCNRDIHSYPKRLLMFSLFRHNQSLSLNNIALMGALVPGFEMRISSALVRHSIYTTCTHSFAGCVGRWIQQVGPSLLIALRPLFEENLDNQLGAVFHHPSDMAFLVLVKEGTGPLVKHVPERTRHLVSGIQYVNSSACQAI